MASVPRGLKMKKPPDPSSHGRRTQAALLGFPDWWDRRGETSLPRRFKGKHVTLHRGVNGIARRLIVKEER
jgi:hypothetical protein